jgi:hypothetical protein
LIQKAACPSPEPTAKPAGPCNPTTQTGCDRARNEVCIERDGTMGCVCPDGFDRHPNTRVCGGAVCNPQLLTSCPDPEICLLTPFGNYRCVCADDYVRDRKSGFCGKFIICEKKLIGNLHNYSIFDLWQIVKDE